MLELALILSIVIRVSVGRYAAFFYLGNYAGLKKNVWGEVEDVLQCDSMDVPDITEP